ncbi:Ger(x)C family spore germination protein [Cohnella sp. GCM10027633]|uniref:Ger(x)C family spore germination protein n=1 Tax=unclassified Cohnella TaxID=2636738 RepID=UPI00362E724A
MTAGWLTGVRKLAVMMLLFTVAISLAGCWSKLELTERGFVMTAAIDLSRSGTIQLTSQVYKPGSGSAAPGEASKGSKFYINIMTENQTVFGAVRDASNELGRKLQLSHLSALLIGERLARTRDLGQILDFFVRDHEPRGDIPVIITKGTARDFLNVQPMIESTVGNQLREVGRKSARYAGKSLVVTLTELDIRAEDEWPAAVIPYYALQKDIRTIAAGSGLALVNFQDGKVSGYVPPPLTPYVIMLMDEYKGGVLNLPCDANGGSAIGDSIEVISLTSRVKPVIQGGTFRIVANVQLNGSVSELNCKSVVTPAETAEFVARTEAYLKKQLQTALLRLQQERADVIGIGLSLYRSHYRLWRDWKADWPDRFANADFDVNVEFKLQNTGIEIGQPTVK